MVNMPASVTGRRLASMNDRSLRERWNRRSFEPPGARSTRTNRLSRLIGGVTLATRSVTNS